MKYSPTTCLSAKTLATTASSIRRQVACLVLGACANKDTWEIRTPTDASQSEIVSTRDTRSSAPTTSSGQTVMLLIKGRVRPRLFVWAVHAPAVAYAELDSSETLLIFSAFKKLLAKVRRFRSLRSESHFGFLQACPQGYVYSPTSNSCMLNCKLCKANEVYHGCGACEPTCENPVRTSCNETCTENCFCRPGLVRNLRDGTCIQPASCPSIKW